MADSDWWHQWLLVSFTLISIASLSSPLPSQAEHNVAQVLADAGFVSMSLTFQLVSDSMLPPSHSATIFAPSDAAFARSGQPPLSLLQFHASPLTLSLQSLQSLRYGTKIPTMLSGHSITVTTADNGNFSMNNVSIDPSPLYDDGSLIVYGIERFFGTNFSVSTPAPSPRSDLECTSPKGGASSGNYSFDEASKLLRARGYAAMASFLDLQLLEFKHQARWTVLAPIDEVMMDQVGNISEYWSLFRRHVLPCRLEWTDLVSLGDSAALLRTSLEGFEINVTRIGDLLMLNEAVLTFPDMFCGDWIVVHGLRQILAVPERLEHAPAEDGGVGGEDDYKEMMPDRGEF